MGVGYARQLQGAYGDPPTRPTDSFLKHMVDIAMLYLCDITRFRLKYDIFEVPQNLLVCVVSPCAYKNRFLAHLPMRCIWL